MAASPRTRSEPRSLDGIATRLRALRRATAVTQVEFCRRVKIATNTWNQYESAKNRPQLDQAIRIVDAYRVTLDWIYLGDEAGLPHNLAISISQHEAAERAAGGDGALPVGRGPLPRGEGQVE